MKNMAGLDPAVRLLTILNVQSAQSSNKKRKSVGSRRGATAKVKAEADEEESDEHQQFMTRDWHSIAKRARVELSNQAHSSRPLSSSSASTSVANEKGSGRSGDDDEVENDENDDSQNDLFEQHWNIDSTSIPQQLEWQKCKHLVPKIGPLTEFKLKQSPSKSDAPLVDPARLARQYNSRLLEKHRQLAPKRASTAFQDNWLALLASYKDILYPKVDAARHEQLRSTLALHAMNHVLKTRTKVLKNNEHLSKLAENPQSDSPSRNVQDQGFTRPKVLVLAPFRNSAHAWVDLLTSISQAETIENKARFDTEYSLPEGASDKLAENPEDYAPDHVATFKGNIDDSFRLGLKVTRKSIKLFSEFYSCDVIVASPLGLRTSIEKEKDDSDFLSSIEVLIVDQMDVMLMQNWDHVSFIMERLNKLPEEAHGCDFSRVKPWYLDGKATFLRQSILLTAYETPEIRSLYNKTLVNVAGKLKAEVKYDGVLADVPKGIKQVFTRFETSDVYSEDDARFEYFTTKTLPMLRKSAVSSSQTIIFVPSYFDFVRLKRYMKKLDDFSFTSISEYTPTPDVSRARGAFFGGKTSFLLVTERFHFFRRYRIRGAKTFVFYAPPDHANFYAEVLSFPFARPGTLAASEETELGDVDESELSGQTIFSKFDLLRLERICGTEDAKKMTSAGPEATRFTFLF